MGGTCSRKRDEVNEESVQRGVSSKYFKSGSSKWLRTSFRLGVDYPQGRGKCPSLMELCIHKICKDIDKYLEKYRTFSMLPRDITQQIFNELVCSHSLNDISLEAFRDCALEDIYLGDYPGVNDSWMDAISSQASSLLAVDVSGSDVTDCGLLYLEDCINLQDLSFNYCDHISDHGLEHISGFRCCNSITDTEMKPLSGLVNLKELQISCSKVTDLGVAYLKGLSNLVLLNMEGCPVTAACLPSISGLTNLESLNLESCRIGNEGTVNLAGLVRLKCLELSDTEFGSIGVHHISGLGSLQSLNLSFTDVTDIDIRRLCGLTSLKSLNLDTHEITDAGLVPLTSLTGLTHLDLFGAHITDFGTSCLCNFKNLQSLEICGGGLTDAGVKNIKDLISLTLLNLSQNSNLTDKTMELISGLTALVSLNISNSRITNAGLRYVKPLKNLRSLSVDCPPQSSELPTRIVYRRSLRWVNKCGQQ